MKRSRSDTEMDLAEGSPALKKAKTLDDSQPSSNVSINVDNIPAEIWREVARHCADPDTMSNNGGYFATFPLLTTCKAISKAVADLPLWRFLRELKKVPISDEEWTVKNGFADFQWNTRVVYGKTFLRMLNTISTHLKQRSVENVIKEHRKKIPALKTIEDFVVFESYLNVNPAGITDCYDEFYANARIVSALFTLNFSALESVKLYFYGHSAEECNALKIAVVETSHELRSLKNMDLDALLKFIAKKLKMKLDLFQNFFFTQILEFSPDEAESSKWLSVALGPLFNDIESEHHKLAADEKPHPAESVLVEVLDQLQEPTLHRNMPAMNLVNAILRSSYKIGAKRYAQWFIEDNQLEDLLPPNFLDTLSWSFIEWRIESVAVFSIRTKDSGLLTFRLESGLDGFWIGVEMGDRIATARIIPYEKNPHIIEYEGRPARIDSIQAQCGCEKLSRDMFLALLYAISNLDPKQPIYIDRACSTPLELVRMTVLNNEDDGTSCSEDDSDSEDSEGSNEEMDLNDELKDLKDDADKHNEDAAVQLNSEQ